MYVANLLNNLKEFIKNSRYVVLHCSVTCDYVCVSSVQRAELVAVKDTGRCPACWYITTWLVAAGSNGTWWYRLGTNTVPGTGT